MHHSHPVDTTTSTPAHAPAHTPATTGLRPWQRAALWIALATLLALVFLMYLQPEFMVSMADHLWACF